MNEALASGVAFFVAIGLPVIIILTLSFYRRILSHREKKLELQAQIEIAKAQQRAAGGDKVEQRLRVLERIVTDKGHGVADEIERLRIAGE
jgi:hypothetical protein